MKSLRKPQENSFDEMISFNDYLNLKSKTLLNERDLEKLIARYICLRCEQPGISALILAKITELALFCAGNYADACEFRSAGDLLVNPRQVDFHIRGMRSPLRKNRHESASVQFASFMGDMDQISWLTLNTWSIIRKQALLPGLYEILKSAGFMKNEYIASIEAKMRKISNTIAFLSSWRIEGGHDLFLKYRESNLTTRKFIENNLCRFNLDGFEELDEEIKALFSGYPASGFLEEAVFDPGREDFFVADVVSYMI